MGCFRHRRAGMLYRPRWNGTGTDTPLSPGYSVIRATVLATEPPEYSQAFTGFGLKKSWRGECVSSQSNSVGQSSIEREALTP